MIMGEMASFANRLFSFRPPNMDWPGRRAGTLVGAVKHTSTRPKAEMAVKTSSMEA